MTALPAMRDETRYYVSLFNTIADVPKDRPYLPSRLSPLGPARWVTDGDRIDIERALQLTPHTRQLIDPIVSVPSGLYWITRSPCHPDEHEVRGIWRIAAQPPAANDGKSYIAQTALFAPPYKDPNQGELFPAT